MIDTEFRNAKCNILLYRYARSEIKKKQCKRCANLLMYCALDKDGKVVDEDKIEAFLLHEHLLEEDSEGFMRTTEQGEHVLVNEILLPEGKRSVNQRFTIYLSIAAVVFAFLSFYLPSLLKYCLKYNK